METKIRKVSRREFFKVSALAGAMALTVPKALVGTAYAQAVKKAKNPNKLTEEEKAHVPKIEVPPIAEDGSTVPINVTVDHPMTKRTTTSRASRSWRTRTRDRSGRENTTSPRRTGRPTSPPRPGSRRASRSSRSPSAANTRKWMGSADIKVTIGGCREEERFLGKGADRLCQDGRRSNPRDR